MKYAVRFFLLFLVLASLLTYLVVFAPNTPDYTGERSIYIPPGASFEHVVDSLKQAQILRQPWTFTLLASVTGWRTQIKPGHYRIPAGWSNKEILNKLRLGLQDPVRVTIPPGITPERFAHILSRSLYVDTTEVLQALHDPELAADLGTDTLHLFAYMLPDTYYMYWTTSARQAIRRLKQEFDRFFADSLRQRAHELGLTVDEVLRLASIVEWETPIESEKPRVAGVYWNRLRRGMRLQADPTVQYAIMQLEGSPKRRLLYKDYEINHPYNTYRYAGLPPGPLNNPSRSSILAVLYPEKHNYYYFVATGEGGHTFSRTYREHLRKARAYQRLMRQRRRELAERQKLEQQTHSDQ